LGTRASGVFLVGAGGLNIVCRFILNPR
jgi:hypothetical protein